MLKDSTPICVTPFQSEHALSASASAWKKMLSNQRKRAGVNSFKYIYPGCNVAGVDLLSFYLNFLIKLSPASEWFQSTVFLGEFL
jgi:hypothetical protein